MWGGGGEGAGEPGTGGLPRIRDDASGQEMLRGTLRKPGLLVGIPSHSLHSVFASLEIFVTVYLSLPHTIRTGSTIR